MMLQDHFRPPLSIRRHWHAFHNAWATYIASDLNAKLPEGYFAEPNVQFGIEIDIAAFEESWQESKNIYNIWSPPPPAQTIAFLPTDETVEVNIFNTEAGPILAGAIELVSPANKDRSSHRNAFVSKCETYLRQGIGLVIVDVVTERKTNLHNELLTRVAENNALLFNAELYATAYRPIQQNGQYKLDIWQEKLNIGGMLPTLPLWLHGEICLPVELDSIYERTCREQRIPMHTA
ncbi:DUF4058 family protein [Tolypothrix sp. FACHB-123]|uniref:DUF4058 family protein n=1 Tax=Tolypothrix sp. FACHB-123 TaxID=2692868 RepID=UPI001684D655|nr:DUF4058 family protein [Tolypothrix sp. FACHB-123]MBD2353932.1 DUF4058 family protein [Tolypothrix sp. FACHB-123]